MMDPEYLEYRGLVGRMERILSILVNLNDRRDWLPERRDRLKKQLAQCQHQAGKLAEDLQVQLLEEGR